MATHTKFVFFGSSRLSVIVLHELRRLGQVPCLIVTTPDKPRGRKLILSQNVVKEWAVKNSIPFLDRAKLDQEVIQKLEAENSDLFVVASYGRILPKAIIEIPPHKTLNIHPSLLPLYRGPSPLPSAMLDDAKNTGLTIMRIDEEMDHGPIVGQKSLIVSEWPTYEEFEEMMAREGARLLASVMPAWLAGEIAERPQDHSRATYTEKITKEDGRLDLAADSYLNFRKIQAYHEWPGAYFFIEHRRRQIRVKVTEASFTAGRLVIVKVVPEGAREMSYEDFQNGYNVSAAPGSAE